MNNFLKLQNCVSKIGSGITPKGGEKSYKNLGVPLIRSQNVLRNRLSLENVAYIDQSQHEKMRSSMVQRGDVLLNITGASIGRACLYKRDFEANVNQHVCIIRTNDLLNSNFLSIYLNSYHGQKQIFSFQGGGSREALNFKQIGNFKIPDIKLPEQKAIANTLQTWDTAIEKTEALIDAKERQFGWLKSKLIGQQNAPTTKLGDHFGKSIIIEKGKPLIKVNIAENGNIPVIAGGKSSPYSHDQLTHSVPCITISASGAYAGYVWYHDYPIWASDCNVIYSTEHSTEYLYFALKMKQSRIYAFQSGGGQSHVYARDLKNISIPLPPLDEQKRIAHTLNTAQQEITLLKKLAEKYRTQKRGLMQKLLTGQLRVKT